MAITLYGGSGSPPVWKVWLTLEHKKVPYQLKMLSFEAGDQKKPEFLAINPRGQVPALVDGDFVVAESTACAEYIEEKWPEPTLLPGGPRERATARRIVLEANYLNDAFDLLRDHAVNAQKGEADPPEMMSKVMDLAHEISAFEKGLRGEYAAGNSLSLADFSLYPVMALIRRIAGRLEVQPLVEAIGPRLQTWMGKIEALPYFDSTYPPHWRG
jgi:glutathione S-transferase